MSTPHEAILSALDLPEGTRYSPEDAVDMAGALGDLLAACERAEETWDLAIHPGPKPGAPQSMSAPTEAWLPTEGIRNLIARALGVSTEPAQPTRQWAVEHPSWETVAHHSITSALYTLNHAPKGGRARLVTRMSDQTEWVPCGLDGEPLPAQAEPRVWQPGDRVQWLRYSDDTITDTGTVVERDTQQWPGHVPVLPDYYRDGPRPLTHPVYINPKHLSEVTDQAGEAR